MPRFVTPTWLKSKDSLYSSKTGESCHAQGTSHKIKSWFLPRSYANHSTVDPYIQDAKWRGNVFNQKLHIS